MTTEQTTEQTEVTPAQHAEQLILELRMFAADERITASLAADLRAVADELAGRPVVTLEMEASLLPPLFERFLREGRAAPERPLLFLLLVFVEDREELAMSVLLHGLRVEGVACIACGD